MNHIKQKIDELKFLAEYEQRRADSETGRKKDYFTGKVAATKSFIKYLDTAFQWSEMQELQAKHKEWCEKNFGGSGPRGLDGSAYEVIKMARHLGKVSHHVLKFCQGIRGDFKHHRDGVIHNLTLLQDYIEGLAVEIESSQGKGKEWLLGSTLALLGVVEEVGELMSAGTKDAEVDAVGDIVLYLLDYCNKTGIDFEDAVRVTAEKVHTRDWVKNPVNGEVGNG